jgi:RNA polymerase sigma-70 factor, ECF subfamily
MSATDSLDAFEAARSRLFAIAYRMTGSVADAEDLCQETWLRWQRVDVATIESPEGWLVRTVTNLAIDRSRSARHRRERYVGPYLPEPLVSGPLAGPADADDPAAQSELADSLTFAFLVVLDELDPAARAVFLLHDVFGYPFDEVATIVGRTPAACRQIASRTRRRLAERHLDVRRATAAHEQRMLAALTGALLEGDVEAVMALLAPDVVQLDDGGPARRAARRPIVGPYRCARLMVNLTKRMPPSAALDFVRVNANPGVVVRVDGHPEIVFSVEFAPDGRIGRIWSQLNPDKLRHLA